MKYTRRVPVARDVGSETSVSEVFATVSGYSGFRVVYAPDFSANVDRVRRALPAAKRENREKTENYAVRQTKMFSSQITTV